MTKDEIAQMVKALDNIQQTHEGVEYMCARDLQGVLEYSKWQNFAQVIEKAKLACSNAGVEVRDHFIDTTRTTELGDGAEREVDDYMLTRYACYLVAQNGDPRKEAIAMAMSYFAVQTRNMEILQQRVFEYERLKAREELAELETHLSSLVFQRGVSGKDFGIIRSKGDEALFGRSTKDMKKRLGMPEGRSLADFLPTITIKAKDFALEITNFNTEDKNLRGVPSITNEHVKNNTTVRKALVDSGIKPENLPAAEDMQKVQRRLKAEEKKLPKDSRSFQDGNTP